MSDAFAGAKEVLGCLVFFAVLLGVMVGAAVVLGCIWLVTQFPVK